MTIVREIIKFGIKDITNNKIYYNNNNMGWLSFDRARKRMDWFRRRGGCGALAVVVLKEITSEENVVCI